MDLKEKIEHNKRVLNNLKSINKKLQFGTKEKEWLEGQIECVKSTIRRYKYEDSKRNGTYVQSGSQSNDSKVTIQ